MQSLLFTSSDINARNSRIDDWIEDKGIKGSDLYRIDNNDNVKIDQIRALSRYLHKKPMQGEYRAGIVLYADKLTIPAQNAFLKLLEEPPKSAYLLLGARNSKQLLPTIVSRCLVIDVPALKYESRYAKEIEQLLENRGVKAIFENADSYGKNKETAEEYLQELLLYIQTKMKTEKSSKELENYAKLARKVHQSLGMLAVNVNPRQILENLFM